MYDTDTHILLKAWQGIKNLLQYSVCRIPGLVAEFNLIILQILGL